MNVREISTLWVIGLAAIALIIWDHRSTAGSILQAIGGSPAAQVIPDNIKTTISADGTTNDAVPIAGNEFGRLATYGNVLAGDVQPNGLDKVFGNVWDNLAGQ